MSKRVIELKINKHPSGRHTLMQRDAGGSTYHDLHGELFGNLDADKFRVAVDAYIVKLTAEGHFATLS